METILFMLTGHMMDARFVVNIHILNDYIKKLSTRYIVHVACISGRDDFDVFEDILPFTYKVISPKKQLDKVCDFISEAPPYDWYVKVRAEVKLLEQLDFDSYSKDGINARARVYEGPLSIKNGAAVGGKGTHSHIHAIHYSPELKELVMDDTIFIVHRNVVEKGGFAPLTDKDRERREWYNNPFGNQEEWFHTSVWKHRNIPLNLIGIYVDFTYLRGISISGDINLPPCEDPASECPKLRIY